jgi:hypothetical protein
MHRTAGHFHVAAGLIDQRQTIARLYKVNNGRIFMRLPHFQPSTLFLILHRAFEMAVLSRLTVAVQVFAVLVCPILAASVSQEYDYVIVGGGLTGLVVANRLSEDKTSTRQCSWSS